MKHLEENNERVSFQERQEELRENYNRASANERKEIVTSLRKLIDNMRGYSIKQEGEDIEQ